MSNIKYATLVFASLVVSCGGGGGSSSAPASNPPPPASMIPSPPLVGSTLYAYAAVLRPLNAGDAWNYRGVETGPGVVTPVVYVDTVTQSAGTAGATTETATNFLGGGPLVAIVTSTNGSVSSDQFGAELRSPVRQNDQFTVYEQFKVDSGSDVDGDGKNDLVDIGVYRLVIGNESVSLPNVATLTALHVDTISLYRFYASSNGQVSPIIKVVQSEWYAAGIGVVRQALTLPTSGPANHVYDERLTYWDGLTQGLGALASQSATVPAGASAFAGLVIPDVLDALTLGDHSVIRSSPPINSNTTYSQGFYFSLLDQRGNVTNAVTYDSLVYGGLWTMVPAGQGFAEIGRLSSLGQGTAFLFDSQANLLSPATGIAYDVTSPTLIAEQESESAVASDGSGLWVLWRRSYVDSSFVSREQLVLREFDFAGQPLVAEIVLASLDPQGGSVGPQLAVSSGYVLASWQVQGTDPSYAVFKPFVTTAVSQTLGGATYASPIALTEPGQFALTWGGGRSVGSPPPPRAGVLLDPGFAPILAPGSSGLASETLLSASGVSYLDAQFASGPVAGMLYAAGTSADSLYQGDPVSTFYFVAEFGVGLQALSTITPRVIRFAGYFGFISQGVPLPKPLVFADRVIVLTLGPTSALRTTVVWLR